MRVRDEEAATDRALLVLTREVRRTTESAERMRLVVDALALRRGVVAPGQVHDEAGDGCE